jgi:hypothetical protein
MQQGATRRKDSDRTAKPLFAGSIPARASASTTYAALAPQRAAALDKFLGKMRRPPEVAGGLSRVTVGGGTDGIDRYMDRR